MLDGFSDKYSKSKVVSEAAGDMIYNFNRIIQII